MKSRNFTRFLWSAGDAVVILLCGREIVVGKVKKDDSVMVRKARGRVMVVV